MSPTAALMLFGEKVNDPLELPTFITWTVTPVPAAVVPAAGVAEELPAFPFAINSLVSILISSS